MNKPLTARSALWSLGFPLLLLAAGLVVAGLFLWQLSHILLLIFASVLVAVLLRAVADLIRRYTPLGEGWSVAIAIFAVLLMIVGFIAFLGAQIYAQVVQLIARIPEILDQLENLVGIENLHERIESRTREALEGASLMAGAADYSTLLAGTVTEIVLVFVAGVYFALSPGRYKKGLLMLFPERSREEARETVSALSTALRLWLLGQILAMVLVGVITTLGLWALGVPSALGLGFIAGIFEFVPLVGPIASAVPAIAVAAAEEPTKALWVAGLYILVQQIEGNLITPLVQQRTVDLPPVLTIFGIIAFGTLFGPLGVLLATPMAVVVFVVVKKIWIRDALHEETELPGENESAARSGG